MTSQGPEIEDVPEERTVKSVVLTNYGSFDKIVVQEWPIPSHPSPGHVMVQVAYCGVNFADVYMRRGLTRDPRPPCVLGIECSGTVTALGSGVTGFKVGDRVVCYQHTGGLHRVVVMLPAACCFLLPDDVSLRDAAALPANYLTAYLCLLDIGNLRPGQSVFVHSCAGGVGSAVAQLAHTVADVTVYGTAAAWKAGAAHDNGVAHVLAYERWQQDLRGLCPEGVHVAIDSQAGRLFEGTQAVLRPLGRAIIIGANSMMSHHDRLGWLDWLRALWSTPAVSSLQLVLHNRVVAGLHLGQLMEREPRRVRAAMEHLLQLLLDSRIKPRVDSVWPLDQAADATRMLAERRNVGKVLLECPGPSAAC